MDKNVDTDDNSVAMLKEVVSAAISCQLILSRNEPVTAQAKEIAEKIIDILMGAINPVLDAGRALAKENDALKQELSDLKGAIVVNDLIRNL